MSDSEVWFEAVDSAGRSLQASAEQDGTLTVGLFLQHEDASLYAVSLDDAAVNKLQIALAAYLHTKTDE